MTKTNPCPEKPCSELTPAEQEVWAKFADKKYVAEPTKTTTMVSIQEPRKRSWEKVKKYMRLGGYDVDLRKASKTVVPLHLSAPCGCEKEVRRKKDFPLVDELCACGKTIMIEWR